jgi:hypothetical protein
MTTKSLLRLCAGFVGATGIGLIIHPGFVILLSGGGISGDRAMAGGVGLVLLLLSLKCWPNGDDIDGRAYGPFLHTISSPLFISDISNLQLGFSVPCSGRSSFYTL